MKHKKLYIFLLFACIFLIPQILLASGDVGNSHSSSFSSSSSSSSSSASFFYLFYLLPFPLNLIVFCLIIYTIYAKGATKTAGFASKQDYKAITQEDTIIKELKEKDSKFSKYAFYTYAKEALINIQEAQESKNIDLCSPYIDPELKSILATSVKRDLSFYYQEQEIIDTSIIDYKNDEKYDFITIQIFMTEIYYEVNKNKQIEFGHKTKRIDSTYNIQFKRKTDIVTSENKLSTSNCPSCGAPNSINNEAKCEFCGQVVNNGDFSFIVTSIAKINPKKSLYYSKFHANKIHALNNEDIVVSQIKVQDDSFELIEFENFVSESFLAVQDAWEKRDMTKIRNYETQDLYDIHSTQIKEFIEKGYYPFIENQDILDIHLNRFEVDGIYEYLTVYVKCNLKVFKKDENGTIIAGNDKSIITRGYALRYKRKHGVTFKNQKVNNCPNCGASIELGEIGNCLYCNSQVINGEHGFVMDSYEAIYKI